MKNVAALPEARAKEPHPFLTTLLAIGLIALCLWAANWQYQRGVARHERNAMISSRITQAPIPLTLVSKELAEAEWRQVKVEGSFDPRDQILLRNRYFEGKYGFDLLTLFTDVTGKTLWVDRGWIAPGKSATTAPELPNTSTNTVAIVGRVRLDQSLPQGSFFAISPSENGKLIKRWNAQSKTSTETENFYLDLLQVSDSTMEPKAPVQLPELTDGPHMAYALQWIFFGGLVGYGRFLLRRSR